MSDNARLQARIAELEGQLAALSQQPAEAEGGRIANGFVILDGMAFSKDEILTQRVELCDALDIAEKLTAERDQLRAEIEGLRLLAAECDEYLRTDRETTIGSGSILHRRLTEAAAMAAKEAELFGTPVQIPSGELNPATAE